MHFFIDDIEYHNIIRKTRKDVYETYQHEYVDLNKDEIGWMVDINTKELSAGNHVIKVVISDSDEIDIVEKEVKFSKI